MGFRDFNKSPDNDGHSQPYQLLPDHQDDYGSGDDEDDPVKKDPEYISFPPPSANATLMTPVGPPLYNHYAGFLTPPKPTSAEAQKKENTCCSKCIIS